MLTEYTEGKLANGVKDGYSRQISIDEDFIFLGWFTVDTRDGYGLEYEWEELDNKGIWVNTRCSWERSLNDIRS